MSFLNPLFLFGLLGIALPIWLHRLQTQTTEREQFSSNMFLEASKHRIHVRRKLKYLLLLALRILFLTILVLAFTRPVFLFPPKPVISEDATHHVIVLDTSFSMHEGAIFAQAINLAEDIISNLEDDDQASIYSASSSVATLAAASSNQVELRESLQGLSPGVGRLDIGAMISALNGLIEASPANFTLHIISDFQQSGQALRFADMIPDTINGKPVLLNTLAVKNDNVANWSVDSLYADFQQTEGSGTVRAGITNHSNETASADKTLTLSINGVEQQSLDQTLTSAADGTVFIRFEGITFAPGDNKVELKISPADSLPEDDMRFGVFDNSPPAPVLLLSSDPESLSSTYISAALETAPRGYEVQVSALDDLDTRILQRYPWLIIDDLGAVNSSLAEALRSYVNGGGAILAALGDRSRSLASTPVSGHSLSSSVQLNQQQDIRIQQIDTSHPALQRPVGWNNVNFTQALSLNPAPTDSVLIALDNDKPLLLEHKIGLGRLVLLNTRFDNSWSDLPVKPVFVSFMAEIAGYLSNENVLSKDQVVDSFLQLGQAGTTSGQVLDPSGSSLSTLEATTGTQNIQLKLTGYYQVFTLGDEALIAVNPDIRESDLAIMEPQTLQNWANTVANSAGNGSNISAATTANTNDLAELEIWRVLLILLVIVVLAESLLSNRYLRGL